MVSKKFLLSLFFFIVTINVRAQIPGSETEAGNAFTGYKKILLIPYNPMMHLSDADQDIGEYSELSGEKIRAAFRLGLTSEVNAQLEKIYPTYSLLSNSLRDYDLDLLYSSIYYRMDTVFSVSHPSNEDQLQKRKSIFSRNRNSKTKENHDFKFMNIALDRTAQLPKLGEKYGADLFVFLNQFEIITHYDDCLDLASKIYSRQLKVHYSVYDVQGKELYGDVAAVDFPSNSNDINEIIQTNFPKIAESIVKTIPKKKELGPEVLSEVK